MEGQPFYNQFSYVLKLVRIEVFFTSSSYKRIFLNWLLLVFKILG